VHVPLEIAQFVVRAFEAYSLAGVGFALMFLPRAVARLDRRVDGASKALRLLILPGVVALWPLFAWRWIAGAHEPLENNPHRAKARESLPVARRSAEWAP
jgi:hypothetical protein